MNSLGFDWSSYSLNWPY